MSNGEELNRDMITYYHKRAGEYDETAYSEDRWPERQAEHQEAARVLREIFAGKKILEIATGPGRWTEEIAQTAESITATDINQSMLDEAKQKKYPEGKVVFKVADLYDLSDLPKHDALFGGFIFSHILKQDRSKFIDTINSYVVPGGTIVLMDNNLYKPNAIDRTDERGNTYRNRTVEADGSKHEIVKNYPTEQELRDLLNDRASKVDLRNSKHFWILIYQAVER